MSTHGGRIDEEELDLRRMMEDLTLLLLHLSSWRESADLGAVKAWKGYDFDVLDGLQEKGYTYGSKGAKSLTLTDEGIGEAERLKEIFVRAMGEIYRQKKDVLASSTRSRARVEVAFFCETCGSSVEAPSGYEPFDRYCEGKITREHIMELLRGYHVRHWHTDAQKIARDRLAYNLRRGMEFEEGAVEARNYARKMVPGEGGRTEKDDTGPAEK